MELLKQNSEWQEYYEGPDDENQTENWLDRAEFNCGAIQFRQTQQKYF